MSNEDLVLTRHEGATVHVVLNRPDAANRVTHEMMTQLIDALTTAEGCDLLVLSANGTDFTLGRDQSEKPAGVSPEDGLRLIVEVNRRLGAFEGISVACVRGRALGFGSGLAMQCDLTIVSETAVFGFDEILHGFPPLIVETYLGEYLPRKAALDLVLTGRSVPAVEARGLGMVSRVVPDDGLETESMTVVDGLRSRSSSALRRAKSFLAEIEHVSQDRRGSYGMGELATWRVANG